MAPYDSILGSTSDDPNAVHPNSLLAGYLAYTPIQPAGLAPVEEQPRDESKVAPWRGRVVYAEADDGEAVRLGSTSDPFQIDPDPTGDKTIRYGERVGRAYTRDTILSLNLVGGRAKSYDWLMNREEGRRLLALASRDRKGRRRDLFEALSDIGPSDLPFMSLVGTQAGSVSAAVRVADTFKKMQNGEPVTDDEALSATLALTESRRSKDRTWGSMVGDIVREAPGFMLEFAMTGGLASGIRSGLSRAGTRAGIHLDMTRASKVITRELVAAEMKALGSAADDVARKGVVDRVAASVMRNTMLDNPMYRGIGADTMLDMAKRRAAYEIGEWTSRTSGGVISNGFNSFLQWGKNHVSRGLIDFGAWGTEESTIAYTSHTTAGRALADAVGAFFVEAPLKGLAMWAPNQYVAQPLIAAATGNDRTVSRAQLGLMQSALLTGNKAVMDDAESLASSQNLLEYVSENSGRGFGSLLRAAGIGIDKVAGKVVGSGYVPLVAPARRVIRAEGSPLFAEEAGVSVGGKMREWIGKLLGTREDFNRKIMADKTQAAALALGVTSEETIRKLRAAVLADTTAGLDRTLAARIGPSMSKFTEQAVKDAYGNMTLKHQYSSYARYAVANWMAKHGVNPSGMMNLYSRMGYDGILGEMFEERYTDVAKGLFGWDDRQLEEKGFFKNIAQAVKNIYPGFDQLAAEAVGFAMPLVTRSVAMRLTAKVGGDGVVRDTKNTLAAFRDVTRTDEVFEMRKGDYLKAMDAVMQTSADEIEVMEANVADAERRGLPEDELNGMKANLERMKTIDSRRRERHARWMAVEDIARANVSDMVAIPFVSDQRLASDDYAKIPVYSSAEAGQTVSARNAMVEYSPTLAHNLFEFQSSFEGENMPWYRWFAQKAIGFTAGLVTGDFSAMRGNAVEWHARDVGLSRQLCFNLRDGFAREYDRQRRLMDEEAKEQVRAHGVTGSYRLSREELMKRTDAAFAQQAKRIMTAYLQTSQFRVFSRQRFEDQAIRQVAAGLGYEFTLEDHGGEKVPAFYKPAADGTFDNGTRRTADQIAAENAEAVEQARNDITVATVNLMTRHLTRGEYARSKLMKLASLPANFDGVPYAAVESALALVGREDLVDTVVVDGTTPLRDIVAGSSVSRVNMDVVSAIATKDDVKDVDPRLLESVAQSLGASFDGSEDGLRRRNDRIFRLAKVANAVSDGNAVYFVGSTARVEDHDSRINSGNAFPVKAVRNEDGTYSVKFGVDPATGKKIEVSNASYEALVAAMRSQGYEPSTARVVFTQARALEFRDMFTALRELNMVPEYVEELRRKGAAPHPMVRRDADTGEYALTETEAAEELEKKMALASHWDNETREVVGQLPEGETEATAQAAWFELYDKDTGYITVGEQMLRDRGVYADSPIARYAGEFIPHVGMRYTMAMNVSRVGNRSGDVYVPIDFQSGYDYVTSLLNAHAMDAYAKNPGLLRDALGGPISEFVNGVADAVEVLLRDPEVQKDKGLSDELIRFRRAYLKDCDRVDFSRKSFPRMRGKELTPRSFTVLAVQFAMFRAGKSDLTGEYSRATAALAPLVYRLPSFLPFVNVVDLALGGNGFLSEMVRNGAGKEEVLGSQRGIRALLAAVDGNPSAFREAFLGSALPRTMEYRDFVAKLVAGMQALKLSGVPVREVPGLAKAAEEVIRTANSAADTASKERLDSAKRAYEATIDRQLAEIESLRAARDEAESRVESLVESLTSVRTDLASVKDQLARAQADAAVALERMREIPEADQETLNAMKAKYAELTDKASEYARRLRAALEGGDSAAAPRSSVADAALRALDDVEEGESPADPMSAFDDEGDDEDIPPALVGLSEFQEDLPEVFSDAVDGDPMHIRYGIEQKLGQEMTPRQAKLAVNMAVRVVSAAGRPVTEEEAVKAAKQLFRGFSESDLDAVRAQYRALADAYARKGRSLEDMAPRAGNLWVDEETDESAVSEDNFNEKSVAEFESKELSDFLALAWKASPETGRNFQAFVTNVRELNRWQRQFAAEHKDEYDSKAAAALDFVHDILNPRGNKLGKTMAERLALFESTLRQFDDPKRAKDIRSHLSQLLSGGRGGKALSRKGAFLLSYLLSLKANDRNRFAVLVSNSLITSAIHVDDREYIDDSMRTMVRKDRQNYKMSEGIVVDGFSDLIGKNSEQLLDIAKRLDTAFRDNARLVEYDPSTREHGRMTGGNELEVLRRNGMEIALQLHDVFGPESPLFSALTSPRMYQHVAAMLDHGGEQAQKNLCALAKSLSVQKGMFANKEVAAKRTGVEFIDLIKSTLEVMAATMKNGETVTRADIATWFTATFATGDPALGTLTRSVNTSRRNSPLMTLMSTFDDSLPETVMRADFNPDRSDRVSSVAVASRGLIPIGNRFMDLEYDRLCRAVFSESEVLKWNPGKTYDQVLEECRSDMTWPDQFRTPLFAKSLSKDMTARETLAACERTFDDKKAPTWFVPIYAGDHSSAVLLQLPRSLKTRLSDGGNAEKGGKITDDAKIVDVFGNELKSTPFTRKANRVCEIIGLDLLGNDAKRSAVSSLECEGAAMRGVLKFDDEGNPVFGENRIFIMAALSDGFTQEEMKGGTLIHGYGACQLMSMAKDPECKDLKAHLIGTGGSMLAFIKSLSSSTPGREKYAKGTGLRAMYDWLEKQVKDPASTGIFTDFDSYKIGRASAKNQVAAGDPVLMERVFDYFKGELARRIAAGESDVKFDLAGDELDNAIGMVKTADGTEHKLSELLPGVRVQSVDGLSGPAVALSFTEDDMIGYTVANVGHESTEPTDAGRIPRNHEIDMATMAAAMLRMNGAGCHPDVAKRALELVSDWGIVAAATISEPSFMDAMRRASATIDEMLRNGEHPDGQNARDELVRLVNAQLRKNLNLPFNAIDAALDTSCSLRDKNGVVHDHTKSPMYRAMNEGSQWFAGAERDFWGIDRRVAWCNVNLRDPGFRNAWFLDEAAVKSYDIWLRGKAKGPMFGVDFWKGADAYTDDRKFVVLLENVFTELRARERAGDKAAVADIRRHVAMMFQDQYGVTLLNRVNGRGRNYGIMFADTVSFADLFFTGRDGSVKFDRSAVRIDGEYGRDRVQLDVDTNPETNRRIMLGGTMFGLPRTPSYNGSMWLQVARAGLVVSDEEPLVEGGGFMPGRSAAVMPDPGTLDILGCDHDGDKTKLYFFHTDRDGIVREQALPRLPDADHDLFMKNVDGRRDRFREECAGLYARKYVGEDGKIREVPAFDRTEREGAFWAISEDVRKRVSNSVTRCLFDMALALPDFDENGATRVSPNARRPFVGAAVSRNTKAFPLGKDAAKALVSNEKIPEGVLRHRDGSAKNNIGNIRVMTVVSDGAADAAGCRANIVSMMKDLHLCWTTGYFFGKDSLFNDPDRSPLAWFNMTYHNDGISNATFDDMKEQMCSRLGWRSGMVDVLFTDILRNRQDDGSRGMMPTTDEDFLRILNRYSVLVNAKHSAYWWMNRSTDNANNAFLVAAGKRIGAERSGRISTVSVAERLGIRRNKGGEWELAGNANPIVRRYHEAGGDLELVVSAGRGRGHNAMAGYLMCLLTMAERGENISDARIQEFVNWSKMHETLRKARDFASSFNYLNADIGSDVESGRRDRVVENFNSFLYDEDGSLRDVAAEGRFGDYDILPVLRRMHLTMAAAYDVGDYLMTAGARAMLSSSRYYKTVEQLARQQVPGSAALVAKSLILDRLLPYARNRLLLEGNAQQIPYVLAALTGLPSLDGSPIQGAKGMYQALQGIADGVIGKDSGKRPRERILALRHGIEAMFDVMYRLATTSEEHRTKNNVFSYFREAEDRAFATETYEVSDYGKFGRGLYRIVPAFRANTEASVEAIRRKVDLVIRGKSFAGERTNALSDYGLPGDVSSFALDVPTLERLAKKTKDEEFAEVCKTAAAGVRGLADVFDDFDGEVKVTPAMMFGQLLPMYSVLTSRTLGAPTASSPSLLSLLPLRYYSALSRQQVLNDRTYRAVVDALLPLNFAPSRSSLRASLARKGRALNTPPEAMASAIETLENEDYNGEYKSLRPFLEHLSDELRGGKDRMDWRRNPDYRNTFDLFAAGGIMLDAVTALSSVGETQRETPPEPSVSSVLKGEADADTAPVDKKTNEPAARFARALGALAGSWASVEHVGGNVFKLKGRLRGNLGAVYDKTGKKIVGNHAVVLTVTVGEDNFVNDEESVTALANSSNFAASLCAATNFTFMDNGVPTKLTAERFLTLPLSVRKAFVRRYQIGAATSNKVQWSLDGKGVATLCGAIRLNGTKNSTKLYHEYFHSMMRVYDALGMFADEDRKAIMGQFGIKGEWSMDAEERLAEEFRKWVVANTEKDAKGLSTVFRKIMDFLTGLLKSLKGFFSYNDLDRDTLFKMAVHGIASVSLPLREQLQSLVPADEGAPRPASVVTADAINRYVRMRLAGEGEAGVSGRQNMSHAYDEAEVRRLMSGETEARIGETLAGLAAKNRDVIDYLDSLRMRNMPQSVADRLDADLAHPVSAEPGIVREIDESIEIPAEFYDQSSRLEKQLLDVLQSNTGTTEDIRPLLSDLVTVRSAMAEALGYDFSDATDYAEAMAGNPSYTTSLPGTDEFAHDEIRAAVDAGTVATDTPVDRFDVSVMSRVGTLLMRIVENGLRDSGRWGGELADVMRALGNPRSTDALMDREAAIVGIRAAVQAVAPELGDAISKKDIEESLVFETILRVYQRLESSYSGRDGHPYGEGADRMKSHLSNTDVTAWLLSHRYSSPAEVLNRAVARIEEIGRTLGGAGQAETTYLANCFWRVRHLLSDPTGLAAYRRGEAGRIMEGVVRELVAGIVPADGSDSWFDGEGRQKDLKPVEKLPAGADTGVVTHWHSLRGCWEDKPVQEALKLAIRTAYQIQAMAKYVDEFEIVPPRAEDIEFANTMTKRGYAKSVGEADWLASQLMGTSTLMDNRNLVDHYDQSYFIAANVDQWLRSTVRGAFGDGNTRDMLQAEDREYAAIKHEIYNLENFYSFMFGDNVEADGEILKLMEQDREFTMEFGEVLHKTGGKALKFDNRRRIGAKVRMSQDDLRMVDLFKKMLTAHVQHQRGIVTGVDKIMFHDKMSVNPADYTVENIERREREARAGGNQLTKFEEACWRLSWQLPESVLKGDIRLYDRFVNAACAAMKEAAEFRRSTMGEEYGEKFNFNTYVLRSLQNQGILVAEEDSGSIGYDGHPNLRQGALTLDVERFHDFWLTSDTYNKLVAARRLDNETTDLEARKRLSRETVERDFMAVWRKAAQFARQHAWLTEGDGRFLNMFGTSLPFFRGTGVFMYGVNRRDREEKRSYVKNLSKYEQTFYNSVVGDRSRHIVAMRDDVADLMAFLHDMYDTPENGVALRDAIGSGKYERGPKNKSDLVLDRNCTRADVADAIYSRLLERADREEAGRPVRGNIPTKSADAILKMYEDLRGAASDMFGGMTGLNDEQMFRLHGVLPANDQLGHRIHKSIDGLTNAVMQRNTLANMLFTPNADGAPVYYAEPDALAAEKSGLPDEFWANVAHWWAEWNGYTYDEAKSGVENARAIYALVHASAKENNGLVKMGPAGMGDRDFHRYTELPQSESDLVSVSGWMAMDDENLGGDSSMLNKMAGGEAMGYLRQFCQSSRILGFGGARTRATLHRCLSWSKSMSVSFSFFFPLATKWESPIGAVGAMATLTSNLKSVGRLAKSHPELFAGVQKMFSGRGWITKDFLGFNDVVRMMDSNDPFLAELYSWADALGVRISDRYVNPIEPARGIVDSDVRRLTQMVREITGSDIAAAKFSRAAKALFSRSSEKSFVYALNATKLATVAQLCMKLRSQAASMGKAFDPIRDLRRYAGYINSEIGGIDPLKYAWATPMFRGVMNCLLFSWEWTRGAWEAGGGNVIEDTFLGGHSITPEERSYLLGRWARMYGSVMIGVPAMIQMLAWGAAALMTRGGDDDDERKKHLRDYTDGSSPFIWDNEEKTHLMAADLTPILKAIAGLDVGWLPGVAPGTTLGAMKQMHPFALGWLPAYTGTDSANRKTQNRRLYIHFGKQGWEFFRWFDSPRAQFFSKLSMPTQRMLEGFFGRNLGYLDRALPWEDKGALERWVDPGFDGALFNLASAFLPFSVSGVVRTGDAGLLPIMGPVQYGASWTAVNDRIVDRLTAYAMNDRRYHGMGYRHRGSRAKWMRSMLSDIIADARANGVQMKDIDALITNAAGQVAGRLYGQLWAQIPEDPSRSWSADKINRTARALNRLGATYDSMKQSLKKGLYSRGTDWHGGLTPRQRMMYRTVLRGFKADPFSDMTVDQGFQAARDARFDY